MEGAPEAVRSGSFYSGTVLNEDYATDNCAIAPAIAAAAGLDLAAALADLRRGVNPESLIRNAAGEHAMQWAVAEGLLRGSGGRLLPQDNATRAQVAAVLIHFLEKMAET